jgi:transposase
MSIRMQLSPATVKALQTRLQHAYQKDDMRLVRRITVLIDLLVHHLSVEVLHERWGMSPSTIYEWRKAFLVRGLDSLVYRHGGGRPEKLTPTQQKRLVELLDAGPLVVGFESAWWTSVLIRVLIWREFGVLYNRHSVCILLHHLGFSFQKARFVSDSIGGKVITPWPTGPHGVQVCANLQPLSRPITPLWCSFASSPQRPPCVGKVVSSIWSQATWDASTRRRSCWRSSPVS